MIDIALAPPDFSDRRLRLETLVRLRWLAVAGQALAVLFTAAVLDAPFSVGLCFAVVALSAWLNIYLKMRFSSTHRLENRWGALLLAYDIVQLGALLYLTGGLGNPFALLLLAPVLVSATILPPKRTIILGLLVLAIATALVVWHEPLPWNENDPLKLPFLYIAGVWVALACGTVFMGVYAWRVAEEARQLADALTATELVLSREQNLSALDGLAAATAHELGTPLATITLVAKEMQRDLPEDSPYAEDVALIRTQAERCRDILQKLASLGSESDQEFARLRISHLLDEVVEPHRNFGVEIAISVSGDRSLEPVGQRNPGVIHGLGNIVENAVDFASSAVDIEVIWDTAACTVTVMDDGPGFAQDVIDRIGDPFVTTRGPGVAQPDRNLESGGLGLGFFIAKTLLERSGAQLEFSNRPPGAHGAIIQITWPRSAIEAWRASPVRGE
ncbi:MAG: ActS/PrrB/RegB family redox-sensitive histidine kinase [Hyphomicrobiales bacterium]